MPNGVTPHAERGAAPGGGEAVRLRTGFHIAASMRDRLRGLLFARRGPESLLLVRCRDVHTCGMKGPIDVAFIDEDGVVLASYRAVGPTRRVRCRGAVATIERFAETGPWMEQGDRVGLEVRVRAREGERGKGDAS